MASPMAAAAAAPNAALLMLLMLPAETLALNWIPPPNVRKQFKVHK